MSLLKQFIPLKHQLLTPISTLSIMSCKLLDKKQSMNKIKKKIHLNTLILLKTSKGPCIIEFQTNKEHNTEQHYRYHSISKELQPRKHSTP
ncbi:hypothetical protein Hanom_Chr12g01091321 [Helianthus anomalus]